MILRQFRDAGLYQGNSGAQFEFRQVHWVMSSKAGSHYSAVPEITLPTMLQLDFQVIPDCL